MMCELDRSLRGVNFMDGFSGGKKNRPKRSIDRLESGCVKWVGVSVTNNPLNF